MLKGSCLCGSVQWQFDGAPESATACNCTACRRYGVLWAYDYEGEGIHVSGTTKLDKWEDLPRDGRCIRDLWFSPPATHAPEGADPMELIRCSDVPVLSNSGVESHQLLFPENSSSTRVTITKVILGPGAINPRHRHDASEQIWVAISGSGSLLLGEARTLPFLEGDVVRFADGEMHGLENTGSVDFVYLSVTSPPINFRSAYSRPWSTAG